MPGKLVHFEIRAHESERARSFWGGLFGWQFQDSGMPMDYQLVRTGEDQGGAVYPDENPGALVVYFDTDDIDASLAKARELGGRGEEKQPIPGIGWFARCTDTEGNEFSLFQGDESAQMPS
jgi:predicted enzyme related to lactoylglutathione lyase